MYIEYTGIEVCDDKHTVVSIGVKLNEISYGSRRYFLWKCSTCKNEWTSKVVDRTNKNSGCPKCGRLRTIEASHLRGEPLDKWCNANGIYGAKIKSEFTGRLEDGTIVTLGELSKGSSQKVYWKCSNPDCKNEWAAMVKDRTSKQRRGCSACGGTRLIKGKNDLETYCHQHPELSYILKEFVGLDELNQHIIQSEIARSSKKKVYWKCNKCHKKWLAAPAERAGRDKTGCPHCAAYMFTSFPEQYIYHSLLQLFPKTKNRQKDIIKQYEYDIVIPDLKLCIEYSGVNWHADKLDRDQAKADHCKESDVKFLQIYAHQGEITDEQDCLIEDSYKKDRIIYKQDKHNKSKHIKQLQHIIEFILKQYAPNHSVEEINFELAEQQANEVMGKA